MTLKETLENQNYRLVGKHAAVKTCHWTKQSIRGEGVCYKQKFYGIDCHRCLQMTPVVDRCNFNCVFCWRPMGYTQPEPLSLEEADDPKKVVDESIEAQQELLIGFKGSDTADKRKVKESLKPNQVAISLAGEPTQYPKLGELINEYGKRDMTTFLVTNGTNPDVLENLNPMPTQLYISLSAPDEELHQKINRPLIKDGFERLKKSLELMKNFNCRTVVRLTLTRTGAVKPEKYAELIREANPLFVEPKSYMHVGPSRERLSEDEMLDHSEILDFSKKLQENLPSYELADDSKVSRVSLLSRVSSEEQSIQG